MKEKWYGKDIEEGFKKEIIREEELLGENSQMMKMPIMTIEDFRRIIGNQKNGKAAGTDNIKTEVLKHLIKNEDFSKITTEAINKIHKGKIHRRMKETRTTMLQKTQKPGIMDWRPIAVGSIMSKTICTLYREKIEDHLKDKNLTKEIQYGFTKKGRVEQCIFTVNHITNMTYESRKAQHKNLYFAFVDFKKAYDSVDRWSLIKATRKYGVHTEIIEVMVQIYSEEIKLY